MDGSIMGRANPMTLLLVLLGAVPVVVAGAGLVAFLLRRAGYGILVWGVVPFLASLMLVGVIGVILGRAAAGTGRGRGDGEGDSHGGRRGPKSGDG